MLCTLSIIAYISSIASTIFESIRGVFILKLASFIYLLYTLFLSPCRFFIKGNTHSCIILYILCAGKSWKTDHFNCSPSTLRPSISTSPSKILLKGNPSIAASFALILSALSISLINIRYVICSTTSKGFVIPPVQNISHNPSILFFNSPVIISLSVFTK